MGAIKKTLATVAATAALLGGSLGMASPASAAPTSEQAVETMAKPCGYSSEGVRYASYYRHCGSQNALIRIDFIYLNDSYRCIPPNVDVRLGWSAAIRWADYQGTC